MSETTNATNTNEIKPIPMRKLIIVLSNNNIDSYTDDQYSWIIDSNGVITVQSKNEIEYFDSVKEDKVIYKKAYYTARYWKYLAVREEMIIYTSTREVPSKTTSKW